MGIAKHNLKYLMLMFLAAIQLVYILNEPKHPLQRREVLQFQFQFRDKMPRPELLST